MKRSAGLALLLLGLGACATGAPAPSGPEQLTNPFLGPAWSQWLVGPIARMASPEEIAGYLALRSDEEAEGFVEEFWQRRDPRPDRPGNPVRQTFDQRAEEADRRFSEAGYRGRRTDRGTVFTLYGEPDETRFEVAPREGAPPIEVWDYGDEAGPGLDGRKPASFYRFHKPGDLTVFYRGPVRQRSLLERRER